MWPVDTDKRRNFVEWRITSFQDILNLKIARINKEICHIDIV
jgi:hypothetical protein